MLLLESVAYKNQACHQNLSVYKMIVSTVGGTYRIEVSPSRLQSGKNTALQYSPGVH